MPEIANEGLMPSQLIDRLRPRLSGEALLVLAVLADAVDVLQKYHGVPHPAARHEFELAYAWIASGDMGGISFDWACEVLKLNPQWIREQIARVYGGADAASKAVAHG